MEDKVVMAGQQLLKKHGPVAFEEFRRIVYGFQPSALGRLRILRSEMRGYLRVRKDGKIEILPQYIVFIKPLTIDGGACVIRRPMLKLPPADSKPSRPF